MGMELEQSNSAAIELALSCLKYDGYEVPILDTLRLFCVSDNDGITT
jgi:hypothetical protein